MEQTHLQPTFGTAAGNQQQQELVLSQHAQYNLASDNGTAQFNSSGEHSRLGITSNLQSCPSELSPADPPKSKRRKRNPSSPRKFIRKGAWKEAETSSLLERVNLPAFRYQKRKQDYINWDAIAKEIQKEVGLDPAVITAKRCDERMKTLRGCYEKARKEKKEAGVTEEKWRKSNGIAVGWWYTAIGEFCAPRKGKLKDRTPATETEVDHIEKSKDRTPATETGVSYIEKSKDQTPATETDVCHIEKSEDRTPATDTYATRFNSLTKLRRSTLLDLYFFANYFKYVLRFDIDDDEIPLSRTCELLSTMQSRSCLAIYEDVIALHKMGLLRLKSNDEEGEGYDSDEEGEGYDSVEEVTIDSHMEFSGLYDHETFFRKAVDRNPAYDTRRTITSSTMLRFDATCAPIRITMLLLRDCMGLEVVDLSDFRQLRFLSIRKNPSLREMIGWECLEELRYLEVYQCFAYDGYPPLQKMPSLQEFMYCGDVELAEDDEESPERVLHELDVSGCVRLRTLDILDGLGLSSIRGLEGLHSLTRLKMDNCMALGSLPDLSHMKDLTHLTIYDTCVEEIKGVERLSSLKELDCTDSKLKTLPDLSHLPYLELVRLYGCPLIDNPSSPYYTRPERYFKYESKHVDVSDTE